MATTSDPNVSLEERLGSDLRFPIMGNFEPITGVDLVIQDINQLLLTVPGERVSRPDYGCELRTQIWENIDDAAIDGSTSIEEALDRYEPRITVLDVNFQINRNTDLIIFNIQFMINQEDVKVNLVFPFRTETQLSFQ